MAVWVLSIVVDNIEIESLSLGDSQYCRCPRIWLSKVLAARHVLSWAEILFGQATYLTRV